MQTTEIFKDFVYVNDLNMIVKKSIAKSLISYSNKLILEQEFYNTKLLEYRVVNNLRKVIFEVTQNCNLRCQYCIYGEEYLFFRSHSSKKMSFSVIKEVVNYLKFVLMGKKDKKIIFSFYGGEPLLNFKLIYKAIQYINVHLNNWEITYSITSNGTLINDTIIKFLIKYNVYINFSLDGPEDIHNCKRVSPLFKNVFKRVMKTIQKIRFINPTYFRERVGFICTVSNDQSFQRRYNFFSTNSLILNNNLKVNFVSTVNSANPIKEYKYIYEYYKILTNVFIKVQNKKKLNRFERALLNSAYAIYRRLSKPVTVLGGTCLMDQTLFINAHGDFHICESMNEFYSIGNVSVGYNYEKMLEIVNTFKKRRETYCLDCEIRFLCGICYVNCQSKGDFKIDTNNCKTIIKYVYFVLGNFIKMKKDIIAEIYRLWDS